MTSASTLAAENLLFGILALQNDFVSRNQLVAATAVWIGNKDRTLESVLVEQGALDNDERQLIAALVRKHLANHQGDPQQSLRALSSLGSSVRNELTQLNDSMVTQGVAQVSLDRADSSSDDLYATQTISPRDLGPHLLRFRVLRPHARGGLGRVSIALDTELKREVAFKELLDEHADSLAKRSRFLREAEITGGLEHPGIVPVYGLGHYADGRPFYAMRFVQGDSLKEAIEFFHDSRAVVADPGERMLQLRRLLARFIDVCEAIEYAHSRGVLHRDLKPGNIMLGKYGETLVVDWGLAKTVQPSGQERDREEHHLELSGKGDATETLKGSPLGTPAFMPPEQADGQLHRLGPASDVYSLGATLYCLLTGNAPFTDDSIDDTLTKVRRGDFPRPREIDHAIAPALESICLRAMALKPEDRYPSAQALADDVEHWLADEPVVAHQDTVVEQAGRWTRRHRSWTLAGAAALVIVSVVSTVAYVSVRSALHEKDIALRRESSALHRETMARKQEIEARQRESHLRTLAEQSRNFDVRLLEEKQSEDVLPEATVRSLHEQLQAMAALPVVETKPQVEYRRRELQDAYVRGLLRSLEKSPFTDEDRARFDQRVQFLREAFGLSAKPDATTLLDDLARRRDARLARLDPLFDWTAPFSREVMTVAMAEQASVEDGGERLHRNRVGDLVTWVPTGVPCPPGHIEMATRFDISWRDAPLVGLSLNFSTNHRYDFMVTTPAYQDGLAPSDIARLPTLGAIADKVDDRQWTMIIAQDGQTLRRATLPPGDGPLRIHGRREGSRLRLMVNDAHRIEVDDPFPLPISAAGEFAVIWPKPCFLTRCTASRQRAAQEVTPLERGNELFAAGEISDALVAFRQSPDSAEVQYKIGLCLQASGDEAEYVRLMQQVADESPQEARQWRLLANVRLMKVHADQEDMQAYRKRMEYVTSHYDLAEIARLLPEEDRQKLFLDIRRIGQRSRIAISPKGDVEDLQLAVDLDRAFNADAFQRRMTRWRLADAYRVAAVFQNELGFYEKAEETLRDLLKDSPGEAPVEPRERTALVSDLAWLLAEQDKLDAALEVVEMWLIDENMLIRPEYRSLLVDRARLSYMHGQADAAKRDVDEFLDKADVRTIAHAEYASAQLLRGMLYEDAGDLESAHKAWSQALLRNWRNGPPAAEDHAKAQGVEMIHLTDGFNFDSVAASWTGELTPEEAYRRLTALSTGAGMGSQIVERVARAAVTRDLILDVALHMYRDEHGKKLGRDTVLRRVSLRNAHVLGAEQMLYVGVLRSAFRDDNTTQADQTYIRSQCRALFDAYEQNQIANRDMITILEFWQGKGSFRDWEKLSTRISPELAASLGYLFGKMHMIHGKPESAERFFRYVLDSPEAHSNVRDWTQRDRARLHAEKKPTG